MSLVFCSAGTRLLRTCGLCYRSDSRVQFRRGGELLFPYFRLDIHGIIVLENYCRRATLRSCAVFIFSTPAREFELYPRRDGLTQCPEVNMMSNPDELAVLMTLPHGVDESIIPGVLASRGIPVFLTERYLARQGRYVEIQVPASRLEEARRALDEAKAVGEEMKSESE